MGRYDRIITIVLALLISAGFVGAAVNYSYLESRTAYLTRAGGIQHRLETKIVALADPAEHYSAVYQATWRMDADDFRLFSEWIMNRFPYVSGMIFAPLVPVAERSRFEEAMREEGLATFRIHTPGQEDAPSGGGNALPVLHVEPPRPESAFLLGLDLESRREFSGILARAVTEDTALLVQSPGLMGQTKEFWLVRAVFRGRGGPISLDNAPGLILLRIDLTTVVAGFLNGKERADLTLRLTGDGKGPAQSIFTSHHRSPGNSGQGHRWFSHERRFPALGCRFLIRYTEKLPHAAILFNWVVAMAFVAGMLIFMALMSLHREYQRRRRANVELVRINKELQQSEEQLRQLNEQLEERVRTRTLALTQSNHELKQAFNELKTAQTRILEQEELLRAIIDSAPVAIIGFNLDGHVHWVWNRAAEKMLGWRASEVMGRPFPTMSQKQQEEFEGFGKQIKSGMTLDGIEVHRQKRDGSPIDYSIFASQLYDAEGNITGNIAVLVDITERRQAMDALRRSETRLQDIINCSSDWIWELDAQGVYTYCSGRVDGWLGYRPEEVLGRSPFDLMIPEEGQPLGKLFPGFAKRKLPMVNEEHWFLAKDGRRVCLSTNGVPVVDGQGRLVGYRGADQNITHRKQAMEALRISETRLQDIINCTSDWIWEIDAQGVYTFCSGRFDNWLGYQPEEVIGRRPFDLMIPEDGDQTAERYARFIGQKMPIVNEEHWFLAKDGRWVCLSTNGVPIVDGQGRLIGYRGADQNITHREQAMEALRISETRLQDIIDCTSDWIWETDAKGTYTFCSGRIHKVLGYQPEEVKGCTPYDLMVPEERGPAREISFGRKARNAPIVNHEHWFLAKDGRRVCMLTNGVPIVDGEGRLVGYRGADQNITERKLLEDQLQRKNEDLERSNAELEQFAYVASHDLQEPLRKVGSFMELVAERYRDQLDRDAREFIDYAVDGARRMKIMIDDLLAYSRVGTRGKAFASVDMMNVMHEVLADLELAIRDSEAIVSYDALPVVPADDSQLQQLFRNLIGNALKYRGPDPPQIRVTAARQEQAWRISVTDNGIGIESRFFERIFQIFQRLHPRDRFDGTGIGLAVCKKIIERHGGSIGVESAPGRGSTFYFTIPYCEAEI